MNIVTIITILAWVCGVGFLFSYFLQGKGNRNLYELVEFLFWSSLLFYPKLGYYAIVCFCIFFIMFSLKIFKVKVNALEKFKQIYF